MDLDQDPCAIPPHESPASKYLESLIAMDDPCLLELVVKTVLKFLDFLKVHLKAASPSHIKASEWLQMIEKCEKEYQPPQTVIGVVGGTGAGKSSVINAILDLDRLLPTSCFRACTACPIEISYNQSDNLYRAEIEFVSEEEWVEELRQLLPDLLDGERKISLDCNDPYTPAGIAYAKVKAVYPRITKLRLLQVTPEQLARDVAVTHVLNTVKLVRKNTSAELYSSLRYFVNSKEKEEDTRMEFWPLIKVVRIYIKAEVLSTGAVLVDLPGLQDNNAARAAVASSYIRSCTALWVVAPIIRAVDDKTAQNIIDHKLERQMKLDGTYSEMTFICSKTDDISVMEAEISLGIQSRNDTIRRRISALNEELASCRQELSNLQDRTEAVNDELVQLEDECDSVQNDAKNIGTRASASMDQNEVDAKKTNLKARISQLRKERKGAYERLSGLRKLEEQLQREITCFEIEINTACVKGRNDRVKAAIRRNFAAGVKQRDDEIAERDEGKNFNPNKSIRNYDEVARDLPVFCVTSREYQHLCGRMKGDRFELRLNKQDTEIPDLQCHAKIITEARRLSACRLFLNSVNVLLSSMRIWAQHDGEVLSTDITGTEEKQQVIVLEQGLARLRTALDQASSVCIMEMNAALKDNIFSLYQGALISASMTSLKTVDTWGGPRADGGLHYWTYRAICRHDGVFRSSRGSYNFNAELTDPILNKLATGWYMACQSSLPTSLRRFKDTVIETLLDFHLNTTENTDLSVTNTAKFQMLKQQLKNRNAEFKAKLDEVLAVFTSTQRTSYRNFEPVIQAGMQAAYIYCRDQTGPGSLDRMKEKMRKHVEENRRKMFRQATSAVKDQLNDMCDRVEGMLSEKIDELSISLDQDYRRALVPNIEAAHSFKCPSERALRREMGRRLEEGFHKLLIAQPLIQEVLDVDGDSEMLNA